jgi:hypothetical protein
MNLKYLSRPQIQNLADSLLIYQRGQEYLDSGAVTMFRLSPDGLSIQARVAGSGDSYRVDIAERDDDLEVECTCPYDGYVCKHIVAVLLYYLDHREEPAFTVDAPAQAADTVLARTLEALEHSQLVELLVRLSEQDDEFRRTLMDNITIPDWIVQQQPVNPSGMRKLKSEISRYFKQIPDTLDESYEDEELDEINRQSPKFVQLEESAVLTTAL